jgi:hypothetical protein
MKTEYLISYSVKIDYDSFDSPPTHYVGVHTATIDNSLSIPEKAQWYKIQDNIIEYCLDSSRHYLTSELLHMSVLSSKVIR